MANVKIFQTGEEGDLIQSRRWERDLGSLNIGSEKAIKMVKAIRDDYPVGTILEVRVKNSEEERWDIVAAMEGTASGSIDVTPEPPTEAKPGETTAAPADARTALATREDAKRNRAASRNGDRKIVDIKTARKGRKDKPVTREEMAQVPKRWENIRDAIDHAMDLWGPDAFAKVDKNGKRFFVGYLGVNYGEGKSFAEAFDEAEKKGHPKGSGKGSAEGGQ